MGCHSLVSSHCITLDTLGLNHEQLLQLYHSCTYSGFFASFKYKRDQIVISPCIRKQYKQFPPDLHAHCCQYWAVLSQKGSHNWLQTIPWRHTGSACIDPGHYLGVVSFTSQPLYPQGNSCWYSLDSRLGEPQWVWMWKFLTPLGLSSQSLYPVHYPSSHMFSNYVLRVSPTISPRKSCKVAQPIIQLAEYVLCT
jgi:hypothetical protein